jgi:hypothetical protein
MRRSPRKIQPYVSLMLCMFENLSLAENYAFKTCKRFYFEVDAVRFRFETAADKLFQCFLSWSRWYMLEFRDMSVLNCHFEIKIVILLIHSHVRRKIAHSIPNEVIGFFNRPNPFSRTMVLESTQPITEMSTRNFPEGKGRPAGRRVMLTASLPSVSRLSRKCESLYGRLQG